MTSKCPVKVNQAAFLIEGSQTEFLVADYGSDCFVQISQVGKVGKLIKAVRDKPDHLDGFSTYTITNLLGADDEKIDVLARQIVEELNSKPPYKSLLLGYSCKKLPPFSTILSVLKDLGLKLNNVNAIPPPIAM